MKEASKQRGKFSLNDYSRSIQSVERSNLDVKGLKLYKGGDPEQFSEIVNQARSFLLDPKGKSESEKAAFHEMINLSVIGFAGERKKCFALISDYLTKKRFQGAGFPSQYDSLAEAVFAEVIGLNVLESIVKHGADLEEIQVIGTRIYEVKGGVPVRSAFRFPSLKSVERLQQNLVLFNKDTFNPRKRWAEVILNDGSRVTLTGFSFTSEPTITIRFYRVKHFSLQALCEADFETINEQMRLVLLSFIRSYFNLVVIGATNTGKTNLIKALIAEMPDHERIVTIEGRYELMLKRDFPLKNVIEYEVVDEDRLHSGEQAFKLALRQSPKRICHTEIREQDANLYVRACTRGHEGSITSVHVNELEDVPDAITDMCMLDGRNMNPERLRKRITMYVTQVGIEMAIVGGKRKVVRIGEYAYAEGEVIVNPLFIYDEKKRDWEQSGTLSERTAKRIQSLDPDGFGNLQELGVIVP